MAKKPEEPKKPEVPKQPEPPKADKPADPAPRTLEEILGVPFMNPPGGPGGMTPEQILQEVEKVFAKFPQMFTPKHDFRFSHYEFGMQMSVTGAMNTKFAIIVCTHCGEILRKQVPLL